MPWWNMGQYKNFLGNDNGFFLMPFVVPLVVWSIFWKGMALWRAAQNRQKGWFVVLLILNTVGIAEIVYLLLFSSLKKKKK